MRGSLNLKQFTKIIPIGIIAFFLLASPLHARRNNNNNQALIILLLLMSDPNFSTTNGGHGAAPYGFTPNRSVAEPGANAETTSPRPPASPVVGQGPAGETNGTSANGDYSGVCSPEPYAAFCGEQDARASGQAAQVQTKINELFQKSGVNFESLRQENANSAAAGTRPGLADSYPVGSSTKAFFKSIESWVNETFPGLRQFIDSTNDISRKSATKSGKSEANQRRIAGSKVILFPNTNDPGETNRYNAACGLSSVNAFSAVDPADPRGLPNVYICWPRLVAAFVRANGNPLLAMADLAHTFGHEKGHKALLTGAFTGCVAGRYGEADRNGDRMKEWDADNSGNEDIATMIEEGQTFGLTPREFAVKSMQRLCGSTDTEDHPSGQKRMRFFRENPRVAKALGCGPIPGACTDRGAEGLASFGRDQRRAF